MGSSRLWNNAWFIKMWIVPMIVLVDTCCILSLELLALPLSHDLIALKLRFTLCSSTAMMILQQCLQTHKFICMSLCAHCSSVRIGRIAVALSLSQNSLISLCIT